MSARVARRPSTGAGMYQKNRICASVVLVAAAVCGTVHAQSLALTYKLEARPDTAQEAPGVVNRCAGFNWMTSIGACGRELLTRIAQPVTADGVYSQGAVFEPAE